MVRPVAVLDANVLYSARLRDLFVRLAIAGHYQARWTAHILLDECPAEALLPCVTVLAPDDFVLRLVDADPDGVATVIDQQATSFAIEPSER